MHPFLAFAQAKQREIVGLIGELVECESPTDHPQAVNRLVDLLANRVEANKVKRLPGGRFGNHLRCEFRLAGAKPSAGQILVLAHSDTVWPLGTLGQMPFREEAGRLWGPGALDMKSGIAFFLYAMRMLRALEIPVTRKIVLQVNSDEEESSESSRSLTQEAAKQSAVVLVLEPGTGVKGKLKTARKDLADSLVTVKGSAAPAVS